MSGTSQNPTPAIHHAAHPEAEAPRKQLIALLQQLFQLDQPDLDFGFYKIMHAKSASVTRFLEEDLLAIITEAFGVQDEAVIKDKEQALDEAIATARQYGAPDPEATEPVRAARAALEIAQKSGAEEVAVYEDLYRFFERYYDDGDFLSRRYTVRESGQQAAAFAVPYDGREVYLHWANRDQYYIKTSEYLTNATFDVAKHWANEKTRELLGIPASLKLHIRLVEANEGEHNNNKTSDQNKRFFALHEAAPVVMEAGELVVQVEYKHGTYDFNDERGAARGAALNETYGASKKTDWPMLDMADTILTAVQAMPEEDTTAVYQAALAEVAATPSMTKRPLIAKYLYQYTKKNTADYFIHKDLGAFLQRELDFYIKNEVMRLDNVEHADAPTVVAYLERVKVLRKIARHIIAFLAQLEDFQKKLWLKKKFVTDTQYCVTLDRIPETLYAEIAANDAQRAAWITLCAIDELPDYTAPLHTDFLKNHPFLMVDTALFPEDFRDRLVASMDSLDETLDGMAIHSENFQALNLMQTKYREQVKCIYIDPPYNAKSSEILYKNTYKHSSWLSMMSDRLEEGKKLVNKNGTHAVAIDEVEQERLGELIRYKFNDWMKVTIPLVHNPRGQQGKNVSHVHEYVIFSYPADDKKYLSDIEKKEIDSRNLRDSGGESNRSDAKNCFYPFIVENGKIVDIGDIPDDGFHPSSANVVIDKNKIEIWPITDTGDEKKWRYARNTVEKILTKLEVRNGQKLKQIIFNQDIGTMRSLWVGSKYDASEYGTKLIQDILGQEKSKAFSYPKSIFTVHECLKVLSSEQRDFYCLDYFAGSGTTGHAVMNLNREDGGARKYILVEMGAYFDTVLKPRLQKVAYAANWKDGKPVAKSGKEADANPTNPSNPYGGLSHAFKVLRLESYEDTLNNLITPLPDDDSDGKGDKTTPHAARQAALSANPDFRRDYMLKYWLQFETAGSPSLLNTDAFAAPRAYTLNIKPPGSDAQQSKAVDLVETFNWLLGVEVVHMDAWRGYTAKFKREPDPELPSGTDTRLILDGDVKPDNDNGPWQFRKIEGRVRRTDASYERVLIIWRTLTSHSAEQIELAMEQDNLMLDAWFQKHHLKTDKECEFDTVYVNGSNNLPNLKREGDTWRVQLIEEAFHQRMWQQQ